MLIGIKSLQNITFTMSKLAEEVTFLTCIQVKHSSSTGQDANYAGRRFPWISSASLSKCRDNVCKQPKTA
jgi:hypothetical protein